MTDNEKPISNVPPLDDEHNPELLDSLIESLKYGLESTCHAELPSDLGILHGLYERLIERHRMYATEDLVADAVSFFLDEEIKNKNEAYMEIVHIAGNEDIFSQCQEMATAIVEMLKAKGECSPTDITAKGFSLDEIKRHWAMSYALAKVELNWMDA